MTEVADTVPAFIDVSCGEFNDRPGRMLAEVAAGAVVRITDRRMGLVKGYLCRELPRELDPVAGAGPIPPLVKVNSRTGEVRELHEGFRICADCKTEKPLADFPARPGTPEPPASRARCPTGGLPGQAGTPPAGPRMTAMVEDEERRRSPATGR